MKWFHVLGTRRLVRGESGSVAVEFALIAPILLFILAGIIDIGSATFGKLELDARLTAAAEYALLQPAPGDNEAAEQMAERLVTLMQSGAMDTAEVVVNNGARANLDGTSTTVTPLSGDAAACYCAVPSQEGIVWGAATSCGTPCGAGDTAGQFVQISATARHVAIFPGYAFIQDDTVSARAVLRLQ
ncbi:TadE/TadG family type IV pilus assembly protein [Roseovarius sp. D0-M9]|uniref:TadE/TadG family type IV pilus assembly protein n=1 Tax=Roseovarius sp. D0-M9 TaxID=3127117 RepID=UPI00300F9BC5